MFYLVDMLKCSLFVGFLFVCGFFVFVFFLLLSATIRSKLEIFLGAPQIKALANFLSFYDPQMYCPTPISQGPMKYSRF